MLRHFSGNAVDPFEIRRRVGRVKVDLEVLDLTDTRVLAQLGVVGEDLCSDDYRMTQERASAARQIGFDGVLAPSAALPGQQTLVVFARALGKVHLEREKARQPPPRLANFIEKIPLPGEARETIRETYRKIADGGADSIRRRRGRS